MSGDPLEGFEDYAEPDWGGEGERAITGTTIEMAHKVIAALRELGEPDACPGADGSVGLEWGLGGGRRLIVDIRELAGTAR